MDNVFDSVSLSLDNGTQVVFEGRQFAGGSWYDEETGTLTRHNLYVTQTNEHVYTITEKQGFSRSHRAYRVGLHGDLCTVMDGAQEVTIPLGMLLTAVQTLAGLDGSATDTLETVAETLRAASC